MIQTAKDEFYKKLHAQLAEKYACSPSFIEYIRTVSSLKKLTITGMVNELTEKMTHPRYSGGRKKKRNIHTRRRSKKFYHKLIKFLLNLKPHEIDDIKKGKYGE